jgi:4-amino-4-deoxy-L-arabinose transferase-like glycosyltransferase
MSMRAYRIGILALLAAHVCLIVSVASSLPWVVDEPTYFKAGLAIRLHRDWTVPQAIMQGPLPFWANQLPATLRLASADAFSRYLFWGRLGMLPFALLCAGLLARLTRLAFGPTAALGALALHVFNPVVIANASLMTADMALASLYVATVLVAWRYLAAPGWGRLCLLGITIGFAHATKYFATFLVPILALVASLAVLRGFRPRLLWSRTRAGLGARLADLLPAALACGALAVFALHACYLWSADGYTVRTPPAGVSLDPRDPDAGPVSEMVKRLVALPGAPTILHALPDPFVRGLDFQKLFREHGELTVLGDRVVPGHPAFYIASFAVKLPLAFLALALLGLVLRRPQLPPRLGCLVAVAIVLPLVYLSLFSAQQMGIRYALPLLPFLCMFGGRAVHRLLQVERLHLGAVLVGLCAAALGIFHLGCWPHYTSAFNALAGDRPFLWFTTGTNLAWPGETALPTELRDRHPEAVRITDSDGPRIGTCIVFGPDLGTVDPRDPSRVHHWLRRFAPVDRLGPWFVFDASEPSFRRAVGADTPHADARGLVELAIALLGAGQPDRASICLQGNSDVDAARVHRAIELSTDAQRIDEYADALLELRRADVVVALAARVPLHALAKAHYARSEWAEAIDVLQRNAALRPLNMPEVLALMLAYRRTDQRQQALALLDRHMPPPDDPWHAIFASERKALEVDLRRREKYPDIEAALRR